MDKDGSLAEARVPGFCLGTHLSDWKHTTADESANFSCDMSHSFSTDSAMVPHARGLLVHGLTAPFVKVHRRQDAFNSNIFGVRSPRSVENKPSTCKPSRSAT